MNKEIKQKWINALVSGKYQQGKGKLCRDNKYCCLGVLAEELGVLGDYPESDPQGLHSIDGKLATYRVIPTASGWKSHSVLTAKIRKEVGLSMEDQDLLIDMNDGIGKFWGNSKPFSQIADWIEENL